MRHQDLVYQTAAQEINDYLFYSQIHQVFADHRMSIGRALDILERISDKLIPSAQEISVYRNTVQALSLYPILRNSLVQIAHAYADRPAANIILPYFNIRFTLTDESLIIETVFATVRIPKQLNRDIHTRILNSSMHKMLVFIVALRYNREQIKYSSQLSIAHFWDLAPDLVQLLERCRGKKYVVLDVSDY